ncbi:MAG: ABC transporter permease [Gemmatimonadetes bacterium]|nr:ABC transporter permease [Gemmatimonadota bacterium]MBK7715563.1 ABC transporter permease [Gemmatimonadota bacterium]MBK7925533.1 ABC transporter permease [Gemmatimonadota bacterium]
MIRNLFRHPVRTLLAIAGIMVTTAMLLDMVLLAGGIERSFAQLLLGRGYQIRISPKGTLPFDSEATIPDAAGVARVVAADPAVTSVGAALGTAIYARRGDSLVTLFGNGIDPAAQAVYQVEEGADLAPGDSTGLLLSPPAAALLGARLGDTLTLVSRLDPQVALAGTERRLVVRGTVRWLYDYRGQPSIGTLVPVLQALAGNRAEDRVSLFVVRVRDDTLAAAATARLRAALPTLEVNSVADLVIRFRERLVYFRQLSYILGVISLGVTVLLVSTLMTITVNERLGEIATLRAIGIARGTIVRGVMLEGALLTLIGGLLGTGLGVLTARFLDRILTSFPGLPAAISFFVPEPRSLAVAALVLVSTGILAGAYPALVAARAPIAATLRTEAT